MEKFGVEPRYQQEIIKNGYGYSMKVDKLRALFTDKDGKIDVGGLLNIANGHNSGPEIIQKKLTRLGMSKDEIQEWLLRF